MIAEPAFLSEYTIFALDHSKRPKGAQVASAVSRPSHPSTLQLPPLLPLFPPLPSDAFGAVEEAPVERVKTSCLQLAPSLHLLPGSLTQRHLTSNPALPLEQQDHILLMVLYGMAYVSFAVCLGSFLSLLFGISEGMDVFLMFLGCPVALPQ